MAPLLLEKGSVDDGASYGFEVGLRRENNNYSGSRAS